MSSLLESPPEHLGPVNSLDVCTDSEKNPSEPKDKKEDEPSAVSEELDFEGSPKRKKQKLLEKKPAEPSSSASLAEEKTCGESVLELK